MSPEPSANPSNRPTPPPSKLLHADLTRQIIGVYYSVYNGLSRTYPEYIYENTMREATTSSISDASSCTFAASRSARWRSNIS